MGMPQVNISAQGEVPRTLSGESGKTDVAVPILSLQGQSLSAKLKDQMSLKSTTSSLTFLYLSLKVNPVRKAVLFLIHSQELSALFIGLL